MGKKGVHEWVVRRVSKELEGWGYGGNECLLKSDGEPSIVALKRSIKKAYIELKGKLEETPPGKHQSNSRIELAVKHIRNQVKTIRDALETRIQAKVPDDHPMMHWILRWATQTYNRYRRGADGRTAYERICGKRLTQGIAEFGEVVQFKMLERERRAWLGDAGLCGRWTKGVWVGRCWEANENVVLTKHGISNPRSIRRLVTEARWKPELLESLTTQPWGDEIEEAERRPIFQDDDPERREQLIREAEEPHTR